MDTLTKQLVTSFKKDYPDNPLVVFGEDERYGKIPGWIDTSSYGLNWIATKNLRQGLPTGRTVVIVGDASTGKTALALSCMRDPSIDLILYFDSEGGGADAKFAEFIGADPNKILYSPIDTVDELKAKMGKVIDIIEKNQSTKKVLLAIDSMSMISTEKEMNPEKGSDYGAKAKQIREYFRTYSRKIQTMNMCLLMTAHYTQSMNQYGPPKTVGGGTIMLFAPSLTIELSLNNEKSEVEKSALGASVIGLRAKIIKSRLGTFAKQMLFKFDMNTGLDPFSGLFNILKDYGIIIVGSKDLDAQIAEKKVPKKSSGVWVFNPWDYPELFETFKKKVRKSGKFRESEFNNICAGNEDWVIDAFQAALDKATYIDDDSPNLPEELDEDLAEEQEIRAQLEKDGIDPDAEYPDLGYQSEGYADKLKEGGKQKGGVNTEVTKPPKEVRPKKAPPKESIPAGLVEKK